MSDQTNAGGPSDFRGSAADKRKEETVMVNAEDLSNLVDSARQEPVPAQTAPAHQTPPVAHQTPPVAAPIAAASNGLPVALVAGILGVLALIVAVALIAYLAGR